MSKDNSQKVGNLIKALFCLPPGTPISTAQCEKQWNISRQSVHWYSKTGWLSPLGHGYYIRQGDTPTVTGTVVALEAAGFEIHIAGKSALDLKGFSHYLSLGNGKLYLYGRSVRHLPLWLNDLFSVEITNRKLFKEHDGACARLCVRHLDPQQNTSPLVSDPERAILEMLDNVPGSQTIEEAKEIMEGMHSLNPGKLQILLEHCVRIRVKRLFWRLCQELGLPVINEIDMNKVDFGSISPYVISSAAKNIAIKNPIQKDI